MKIIFSLLLSLLTLNAVAQNKISYIKLQRTACFGRCPEYTVELFKNGTVIYTGKKNVENIGKFTEKISVSKMSKLLKEIGVFKILSLKNTYQPLAADLPRLHLSFKINNKTKTIKNAESGPKYLTSIGNKIDSLIETIALKNNTNSHNEEGGGPVLNMEVDNEKNVEVNGNDQQAEYPGGMEAMMKFVRDNLRYPEDAKDNNIEGRVICSFVVTAEGKVDKIKVAKGIGHGCDEEAMRVIKSMPLWYPAMQNGKAVNQNMSLPIAFKLN